MFVILTINNRFYLNNIIWSVCVIVTHLFPVQYELGSSVIPKNILEFSPKSAHVRFKVEKAAMEEILLQELRFSSETIISLIRRTSWRSPRNFDETIPFRISGITGQKGIFAFVGDLKHVRLFSDRLQFHLTHNYLPTDAVKVKPLKLSKCG